MTIPASAAPAPGGKIRIRQRAVQCRRPQCGKCPHGPYYWLIWKDRAGAKHEQYLGKTAPGSVLIATPIPLVTGPRPAIGSQVMLLHQTWGTTGPGMRAIWHSCISTFRVDGQGISRLGPSLALTEWVSLRTQDGDRAYRQSGGGRHLSELARRQSSGQPPEAPLAPGDPRWPLILLA